MRKQDGQDWQEEQDGQDWQEEQDLQDGQDGQDFCSAGLFSSWREHARDRPSRYGIGSVFCRQSHFVIRKQDLQDLQDEQDLQDGQDGQDFCEHLRGTGPRATA